MLTNGFFLFRKHGKHEAIWHPATLSCPLIFNMYHLKIACPGKLDIFEIIIYI